LVVILVLGTVGAIVLHGRGSSPNGTATASPTPKTSPKSSPTATPSPTGVALLPIPDYGRTVNPPLTAVNFCTPTAPCVLPGFAPAKDTNCTLGGQCHVDFAAYWSGNTVKTLTFSIEFFDRCNNPNGTSTTVFQHTYPNVGRYSFDPTIVGGDRVTLPSGVKAAVLVVIADTGTVKAASPAFTPPDSAGTCA
jgi:hypothetical protein